jgi:hypothetical protein
MHRWLTSAGFTHYHRAHGQTDMRILFLPASLARLVPGHPAVFAAPEQPLQLPEPRDDRLRAIAQRLYDQPGDNTPLAEPEQLHRRLHRPRRHHPGPLPGQQPPGGGGPETVKPGSVRKILRLNFVPGATPWGYATAAAAARPAIRPENRQPPRNVPSSDR